MDFRLFPNRLLKIIWNLKDVIVPAVRAWIEHDASTMGAALAFYTVFSVVGSGAELTKSYSYILGTRVALPT
jgi:uncharacterized BrkB/YihY/UPF0761 family membrane protein